MANAKPRLATLPHLTAAATAAFRPCGKGWPYIVAYAARLRLCSSPAVQVAQRACVSSGGEATAEKNTYHAKLSSQGISSEDGFQHHSCGPGNRLLDGSVATVG